MKKYLVLPVILIIGGLVWILKTKPTLFVIRNVECKTQYGPCGTDELDQIKNFTGENLLFFDTRRLENSLLQSFKNRKVYVNKLFPDRLAVFIEKRRAFIGLLKDELPGIFLAAKDGMVIEVEDRSGLPTLILGQTFDTPVVGQYLGRQELAAGEILFLTWRAHGVLEGKLKEGVLELMLPRGVLVFYSTERDPAVSVGALQLILAKLSDRLPTVIDLRYSKPVLRYE